jgi:hypothetical protein
MRARREVDAAGRELDAGGIEERSPSACASPAPPSFVPVPPTPMMSHAHRARSHRR